MSEIKEILKRAKYNSRFKLGDKVKYWDQMEQTEPDNIVYQVIAIDGTLHQIIDVSDPMNINIVYEMVAPQHTLAIFYTGTPSHYLRCIP